ncbi:hypothetical protein [Alkalicoccus luteus]|uniref:Uncharacterized protein n=1 Tax=Alkalicoccus luteus TaxID=1237094 RepID=A0A969TSQ8_9BACI|nr:hypothetical protein [Alkalicoccus luteus]NJP36833.1 hypothetical protein [Alkalicoccus luteus]
MSALVKLRTKQMLVFNLVLLPALTGAVLLIERLGLSLQLLFTLAAAAGALLLMRDGIPFPLTKKINEHEKEAVHITQERRRSALAFAVLTAAAAAAFASDNAVSVSTGVLITAAGVLFLTMNLHKLTHIAAVDGANSPAHFQQRRVLIRFAAGLNLFALFTILSFIVSAL